MATVGDLVSTCVWLDPDHLIETARVLFEGFQIQTIAVVRGQQVVGYLTKEVADKTSLTKRVFQVMGREPLVFQTGDSMRMVAKVLATSDLPYFAVASGDRFVGIHSVNALLENLSKSYDPMTQLSWSDELREWAGTQLRHGNEISIIFVDLDSFGAYNKTHGHVMGDRVVRAVADYLASKVGNSDVLVRYGGDEFAIGTLRSRDEAEAFADSLNPGQSGLNVEGVEPVHFSVGVFGGRRTKERMATHFESTVDNLINCASRAALLAKKQKKLKATLGETASLGQPLESGEPLKVLSATIRKEGEDSVATVILTHRDSIISGAEIVKDMTAEEAMVRATAKALSHKNPTTAFDLESLTLVSLEDQVVISLKGSGQNSLCHYPVNLQMKSGSDPYVAIATTTLEALQRLS